MIPRICWPVNVFGLLYLYYDTYAVKTTRLSHTRLRVIADVLVFFAVRQDFADVAEHFAPLNVRKPLVMHKRNVLERPDALLRLPVQEHVIGRREIDVPTADSHHLQGGPGRQVQHQIGNGL